MTMSASCCPILNLTQKASGAVKAGRFVTAAGAHAGAGANTLGVAVADAADQEVFPVTVLGTAMVTAGGAVDADVPVSSDADGKAVAATTGAIAGISRQAATAEDQQIEVLLIQNAAVPAPEPPAGG